jgi:hypothetical protein
MEDSSRHMEIAMSIRSTFTRLAAAAMLVPVGAHTSVAQRIEPVAATSRSVSTDATSHQPVQIEAKKGPFLTWGGVGGGVVGGTAGLFGGMLAGVMLAHTGQCMGEDCSLGSALVGAGVGEVIGLAAGAHVGSARRGNLGLAVLASAAMGATGILAANYAPRSAGGIVVAIPLLQLGAVLALER